MYVLEYLTVFCERVTLSEQTDINKQLIGVDNETLNPVLALKLFALAFKFENNQV